MVRLTESNKGARAGGNVGDADSSRVNRGCERQGLQVGVGTLTFLGLNMGNRYVNQPVLGASEWAKLPLERHEVEDKVD